MLTGTVEVDETFVGGKAKNMHFAKKKVKIKGTGSAGKTVVFGLLKRGQREDKVRRIERVDSQVRTAVIPDTKDTTVTPIIEANVEKATEVFTDAANAYRHLGLKGFERSFVDHSVRYVEGRVYANGMENYWGLLDRMMHGTYTYALPKHLFRYTDELTYRFNHRGGTDCTRFLQAVQVISGKRLTYDALTTSHSASRTRVPKRSAYTGPSDPLTTTRSSNILIVWRG
jgi:transposase-like protein